MRKNPQFKPPIHQSRIPTQPVQPIDEDHTFFQQHRGSYGTSSEHYPDSLERLELYLDRQVLRSQEREQITKNNLSQVVKRRRAHTETDSDIEYSQDSGMSKRNNKKLSTVMNELDSLKS